MTNPLPSPVPVPAQPRLALSPKEAAVALGVSERLLWSLTAAGEVPHTRLGRRVIYPHDLLKRWLADRAEGGVK